MQTSYRHRAFTAIELLLSLTLASMLLVAVLGTIRSMALGRKALLESVSVAPWQDQLASRLRRDLANSREYECAGGELRLRGYAGEDFSRAMPTLRPTEIVYRVVSVDDAKWLLRREIHLDSLSNKNSRVEYVCRGVQAIQMETDETVRPRAGGLRRLPERFCLVLHGRADSEPIVRIACQH